MLEPAAWVGLPEPPDGPCLGYPALSMQSVMGAGVQPVEIVDAYLDALASHDYDGARRYLADSGFSYESPVACFDSADAFMEYTALNMGILLRIERVKTFVDGPDVCHVLIMHIQISDKDRVKVVSWCSVADGRIRRMEVVFDTRIYQRLFQREGPEPG
jgi:hypothetical protein